MDTIEATKMVMSRIQNIDPDNASKIMGYILLIQDQGENEIIRLAFGPENLLASVVNQAKAFLDISSPRIINASHDRRSSPFSEVQMDDGLSFLDDAIVSPGILFPYSNAATDWRMWRPCMYCSRGFCKNGTCCNGNGDDIYLSSISSPTSIVGSPNIDEFSRLKAIQQQQQQQQQHRLAAANHFPFNRCFNFLNETPPRSPSAAALMMEEDVHKFGPSRPYRHDLAIAAMGLGNSSSRQIYLTFPADSTFKEEDVSNYFSMFGPVQDVRIPYQQKRMFGFVTFVLPETVKAILAKGNPHFVCDSRVLVKPYKEKGKIPDKKYHHHHHIERGNFSALESAEPFDHIPFGARMFNNDMMLRKKLEGRAELQQAIEFQERNLMNMQLTDHPQSNQSLVHHDSVNVVLGEEVNGSCTQELSEGCESKLTQVKDDDSENNSSNGSGKESSDLNEHQSIFDHILPDNLFASPTKTTATSHQSIFSANLPEAADGSAKVNQNAASAAIVNSKVFNMKSCYIQMPRSFCGQEAVEM